MSAGTPIVTMRIPPDLEMRIQKALADANQNRKGEPYTRSSWIFAAIREKLDHLERSKRKGKKNVTGTTAMG